MSKVWAYCNFSDVNERDKSLSLLYKLQDVMKDNRFTLEVIALGAKRCDEDIPIQHLQCLNVSKIYCVTNNVFNGINNYVAYVEAMKILINKYNPQYLMFSSSRHNRIVAAQLATALESGLTAECSKYYVNTDNEIVQIRPTFEGNTYAHIISKSAVKMSTALKSSYQRISISESITKTLDIETIELPLEIPHKNIYFNNSTAFNIPVTPKLEKYDVIFAAGMGLGSKENVNKLKRLAKRHNVGFGASRPVVEMGWAEQSDLIGMSGSCVSPNLYLAFGISGSLQHMEGMRNAAKIISINTDKNAPLHQLCYSIILADAVEMLDYLINEWR
ncbi:electron transfer flavoprotein subunit alpha/FixB family protein [Ruminiclostridium josui]|uniref:electron transfer flavoprotein subunit alpha/FixB family protein n=1 Tax=Ruminiclostridium josui TaxID=1499 RepID=UPI0004634E67|nr:electron transfer flavoprotein subunit alpha/FixB family protein [Ruminiclostridium josui]